MGLVGFICWVGGLPTGGPLDYALPLQDPCHLFRPVVLPDIGVTAGGLSLSAFENTLDDNGLTIGTAEIALPRYNTFALAQDLRIGSGFSVSAASLELNVFDANLLAEDVAFSPSAGLSATTVTLRLPALLGNAAVSVSETLDDCDEL